MKREAIAILLICCIAVACLIAAGHLTKQDQEGQQASKGPLQIRFISTSDIHGKILPYDYALDAPDDSGSLAQISSAVNELADDNTVLIDLGDTAQGNSSELFLEDKEHPAWRAQKLMNYGLCKSGHPAV